jgi:hypothetical protein
MIEATGAAIMMDVATGTTIIIDVTTGTAIMIALATRACWDSGSPFELIHDSSF